MWTYHLPKYITLCIIHPSIWKSSSSPNPCSSCHLTSNNLYPLRELPINQMRREERGEEDRKGEEGEEERVERERWRERKRRRPDIRAKERDIGKKQKQRERRWYKPNSVEWTTMRWNVSSERDVSDRIKSYFPPLSLPPLSFFSHLSHTNLYHLNCKWKREKWG